MNDFIQGIGPVDRDVDAVYRVERAREEEQRRQREREQARKRPPREQPAEGSPQPADQGPVEGNDGHLHIDVRA